jgi:membrane-bound lytic murein transglycosylase D
MSHAWRAAVLGLALGLSCLATPARAGESPKSDLQAISTLFWSGVAEPDCEDAPGRWRRHFGDIPRRLRNPRENRLRADFAHVLQAVRDAGLPTELALIPFVESRYRADARSPGGQIGLWQFTAATGRHHGLAIHGARDDRRQVQASTRAAVRYLKRLHRAFGSDWRWTAIAYNAGEGAARGARKHGPQRLSPITRHYPDKLHALACLVPRPTDRRRGAR